MTNSRLVIEPSPYASTADHRGHLPRLGRSKVWFRKWWCLFLEAGLKQCRPRRLVCCTRIPPSTPGVSGDGLKRQPLPPVPQGCGYSPPSVPGAG